jgi:hypothetical protein
MQVAKLTKEHDTKTNLCTNICAKVQFTVQWQVVEFESRYKTLSINRDLTYSNASVATRQFQCIVHTCEERMEVGWATDHSSRGFLPSVVCLSVSSKLQR